MTHNQLKRMVKNREIDLKTAEEITRRVLADGLVSRTEKRFLRGVLKKHGIDETAHRELHRVLVKRSAED